MRLTIVLGPELIQRMQKVNQDQERLKAEESRIFEERVIRIKDIFPQVYRTDAKYYLDSFVGDHGIPRRLLVLDKYDDHTSAVSKRDRDEKPVIRAETHINLSVPFTHRMSSKSLLDLREVEEAEAVSVTYEVNVMYYSILLPAVLEISKSRLLIKMDIDKTLQTNPNIDHEFLERHLRDLLCLDIQLVNIREIIDRYHLYECSGLELVSITHRVLIYFSKEKTKNEFLAAIKAMHLKKIKYFVGDSS